MINIKTFYSDYEEVIKEFTGLPINLCFDEENNLKDIELTGFDKEFLEANRKNLDIILDTIRKVVLSFYDNHKNLSFRPVYKQLLVEEMAYSFIEKSYPELNQSLSYFIEHLKNLCAKTYESQCTEMGFIIIKEKEFAVEEYFHKLGIEFLETDEPQSLEYFIEDKQTLKIVDSRSVSFVINSEYKVIGLALKIKGKQSVFDIMMNRHRYIEEMDIKLLSHSYYVDSKIKDKTSSIQEALLKLAELENEILKKIKHENKIDENITGLKNIIEAIDFENYSEEQKHLFFKNRDLYQSLLETENELLVEETSIVEQRQTSLDFLKNLKREQIQEVQNMFELEMVDFVYFHNKQIIWSSSYEYIISYLNGKWKLRNYFVLRNVLTKFVMSQYPLTNINYIIDKINYSIPRVLNLYNITKTLSEKNIGSLLSILKKSNKRNNSIFQDMLQKGELSTEKYKCIIETSNNKPINIQSCDKYLFELIASVDGAILLDYKLHVLSFGEMIKSQDLTMPTTQNYRGARTLAALSASNFGLSVKISEDGDIQVFESQVEIARI